MLTLNRRRGGKAPAAPADALLELPYETRCRSRFRATLSTGEEAGVLLERGQVLRHGERLEASDGRQVEVRAAPETVSTVRSGEAQRLLRAAYHLGNRHVALQLGEGWLRYLHDHVLDDMVRGLGLAVEVGAAPFEPEAGAYAGESGAGHGHGLGQGHDHGHGHGPLSGGPPHGA
jgi:urease accessory protein